MHRSPLVAPNGEDVFVAGGGQVWKQGTHRGWNVSLEWIGDGKRTEPCMVIWQEPNVFQLQREAPGLWVIGRRAVTEFVGFNKELKCTGSPSEHCFREAREALTVLGKDKNDKQALNSLCDAVITFAPELVLMPVAPKQVRIALESEKMWEVAATNKLTGKTLHEAEV